MTVSVAMATYNGAAFVERQIDSILSQLEAEDELVVSDDGSTDGTREYLETLSARDARVRVLDGPCLGPVWNFENAITACRGDYIFLTDQDDEWMPQKRQAVLAAFEETGAAVVMHDACITDAEGQVTAPSFFAWRGTRTGLFKNLWKNSYIGCCMAFSRRLKPYLLPFPDSIPMHDQWIGLQAERHGGVALIDRPLLAYRRHGTNVSAQTHGSVPTMIKQRCGMLRALLTRR